MCEVCNDNFGFSLVGNGVRSYMKAMHSALSNYVPSTSYRTDTKQYSLMLDAQCVLFYDFARDAALLPTVNGMTVMLHDDRLKIFAVLAKQSGWVTIFHPVTL